MKDPRDIIFGPVVSEKSYDLIEKHRTYTFTVDRRSHKSEIKDAIEEIFSVKVSSVNTTNRQGKAKRTGYVRGRRSDTKRAMVQLAPGEQIDIFGV